MYCPECNKEIDDKIIMSYVATINGRKSRRILTPEDAKRMVAIREEKRRKRKEGILE